MFGPGATPDVLQNCRNAKYFAMTVTLKRLRPLILVPSLMGRTVDIVAVADVMTAEIGRKIVWQNITHFIPEKST